MVYPRGPIFCLALPAIVGIQAVPEAFAELWPAYQDALALQELDGSGDLGARHVKDVGDLRLLNMNPILKVELAEENHEHPVGLCGQVLILCNGKECFLIRHKPPVSVERVFYPNPDRSASQKLAGVEINHTHVPFHVPPIVVSTPNLVVSTPNYCTPE